MQKHYWLHLVLTVFLSLLLCNSVKAYMTIDDYQKSKKRDPKTICTNTSIRINIGMGGATCFIRPLLFFIT